MPLTCSGQPLARGRASIRYSSLTAKNPWTLKMNFLIDSAAVWNHLQSRDGWTRPHGTDDDQAQMMVTCMETWIMSDRGALRKVFGARLEISALLPVDDLEQRSRSDVQPALENATRNCGADKAYRKGRRSFQVSAALSPSALMDLPHFKRFIEALNSRLPEGTGGIAAVQRNMNLFLCFPGLSCHGRAGNDNFEAISNIPVLLQPFHARRHNKWTV